jgi:O-antigen/teichoic acid export membrane protein
VHSFGKQIISGIIWGQGGKLVEIGLNFIFIVLIVRLLSPRDYGQYGLINNVVGMILMFTSLGLYEILGSQIPKLLAKGSFHSARRLTSWVVLIRLAVILASVGILVVFRDVFAVVFKTPIFGDSVFWICLLLIFMGLGELLLALFTALLRIKFVTISRSLAILASIGSAIFIFHWQGPTVKAVITASSLGWGVIIALTILNIYKQLRGWKKGSSKMPPVAKYGLTIWVRHLLNFGISTYSSVFFLGILAHDTAEVAYYNVAVLPVARAWWIALAGLATIILPAFSEVSERYGEAGVAQFWETLMSFLATMIIPVFSYLFAYTYPLVMLLFGDVYLPSAALMQVCIGSVLLHNLLGSVITLGLFNATGRQTLALITTFFSGALKIIMLVVFIPHFFALGAIIADAISSLFEGMMYFLLLKRKITMLRYPLALVFKLIIAAFIALLLARLLIPLDGNIKLIISIILSGTLFVLFCFILKPLKGQYIFQDQFGFRWNRILKIFGG